MTDGTDDTAKITKTGIANGTSGTLTAQNIGFDIYKFANELVKEEWFGRSMANPSTAEDYILMGAANPNIANELPAAGLRFWRACKFQHDLDKAREKFNRPARKG